MTILDFCCSTSAYRRAGTNSLSKSCRVFDENLNLNAEWASLGPPSFVTSFFKARNFYQFISVPPPLFCHFFSHFTTKLKPRKKMSVKKYLMFKFHVLRTNYDSFQTNLNSKNLHFRQKFLSFGISHKCVSCMRILMG